VRFWDASSVVPLLINEPSSRRMLELLERDEELAVWWGTDIECRSAIARAQRAGRMSSDAGQRASEILEHLGSIWLEISPSEEVRRQARRLLRVHALRAADAQQLGAALVWCGKYDQAELVTLDGGLGDAAQREGFLIV
jgi:predicted nucleic acid-binding protein